jgi:hypothetical protein
MKQISKNFILNFYLFSKLLKFKSNEKDPNLKQLYWHSDAKECHDGFK